MAKRIPKLHYTQIDRFWRNVDRSGGPDACWLWTGFTRPNGYGSIGIKYKEYKAHRVSYFIEHGSIDSDTLILHRCDVRACVNPAHLFRGTPKDNSQDAVRKGRNTRLYGEQNGKAKLTRAAIVKIRRLYKAGGVFQRELAEQFGVCEATISYVINGGRWKRFPPR
jgi:hypothetical protein